jgi:sulfhydrogenase subunit delta
MRLTNLNVGIYEFTGCAGDALTVVHSEDELLDFFSVVNVSSFLMAKADNVEEKLDVAVIEGSIATEDQIKHLKEIAARSKVIVAIGICASFGGIQAMKHGQGGWQERFKKVYGKSENEVGISKPFESRPISDFVKVDYIVPGCPIDKNQFFKVFTRLINGAPPEAMSVPVCVECKWKANECLLLKNVPCLGPITSSGCGAACPSYNLPCLGCWGPYEEANITAQYHLLKEKGFESEEIKARIRNYGGSKAAELLKEAGV